MSSPLKQNTTTIQNLLDTINSLPDTGSSGESELKLATGTFNSANNGNLAVGTEIATITGLTFKPKHVIVTYDSGVREATNVAYYHNLATVQFGLYKSVVFVTKATGASCSGPVSGDSYNDYINTTINDDGFSISSNHTYLYVSSYTFRYVSIG